MRGTRVGETFPLLLKLISARQWLSVQVHPDDAYAFKNENGKLGKAEAWVILEAEPGAKIVFGIREGVTRAQLEEACRSGGKALEECLRFTGVRAGEVYSIPAGTAHALGGGITLAEIQQSSDVTYRFYDWNRTDAQGNRRPLHIQKGLDVVRLGPEPCACAGTAVRLDGCAGWRYVDGPAFTLDRYPVRGRLRLSATPERFRLMTALGEGILRWEGGEAQLRRGDSVFLPAMLEDTELTGELDILMMAP
jgi:mannose-6-phosphate isomerase